MRSLWKNFLLTTSLLIALWFLFSCPRSARASQTAVMVWDSECLSDVHATKGTKLIAPLVDGEPDMKHSYAIGVNITYAPGCGRIEVQK